MFMYILSDGLKCSFCGLQSKYLKANRLGQTEKTAQEHQGLK